MHGLITQFLVQPGQRDAFIAILSAASRGMPGCLSYVIARDAARDDAVWVSEIWTDAAQHAASLSLPAVQTAMSEARPLIAGMGLRATTEPVAGV